MLLLLLSMVLSTTFCLLIGSTIAAMDTYVTYRTTFSSTIMEQYITALGLQHLAASSAVLT